MFVDRLGSFFVISPMWHDWNDAPVVADGLFPVGEPFNPFLSDILINHISGEGDKERSKFSRELIGENADITKISRVTAGDKGKSLWLIRGCAKNIASARAGFIGEAEEIIRVRLQILEVNEAISHAVIFGHTIGFLTACVGI